MNKARLVRFSIVGAVVAGVFAVMRFSGYGERRDFWFRRFKAVFWSCVPDSGASG